MIALGIDPGSIKTGYGIVRKDGSRFVRLASGTIKCNAKEDFEKRLVRIHESLSGVLTTYGPDEAAVEDVFFSRNAMSALKLGQARGVILLTIAQRQIPIFSYAPAMVKRSVVGAGRAAKGQIQRVVGAILKAEQPFLEDEADALAVAICHLNSAGFQKAKKSHY